MKNYFFLEILAADKILIISSIPPVKFVGGIGFLNLPKKKKIVSFSLLRRAFKFLRSQIC